MAAADVLFDNPILTKFTRSRLRRSQVTPWLVVVFAVCITITWVGFALPMIGPVGSLAMLLGLQVLFLALGGSQQIGAAVGGARQSSILDFHRVSPLPPSWVTLGFFLGAPIREYLVFLCILPFALVAAYHGSAGVFGLVALEIPLLLAAWVFHAVSLLFSLTAPKPKGSSQSGIGGLIVFLVFLGQPIGLGLWYAAGDLQARPPELGFFGLPVHWMAFVALYEIAVLGILFLAATRKMQSERAHAYSKPQAIASLAILSTLTIGGLWAYKGASYLAVGVLYGVVVFAMIFVSTITPMQGEYVRGVRRALRNGLRRPSPWDDAGTNRAALVVICGIVLVTSTVAWEAIEGRGPSPRTVYSQTFAVGVLTVATVGLAKQYFQLRLATTGRSWVAVFLMLTWLIPLLAGAVTWAALPDRQWGQAIMALCPLAGIALSVAAPPGPAGDGVRLAAVIPPVAFTFLFNYLLVVTQRRIDLTVQKARPEASPANADQAVSVTP